MNPLSNPLIAEQIESLTREQGIDRASVIEAIKQAFLKFAERQPDIREDERDALLIEQLNEIVEQSGKQSQNQRDPSPSELYDHFAGKVGELVNGYVKRFEGDNIIVDLGNIEAILPRSEQSRSEQWKEGQQIRVVINKVSKKSKGQQIEVSRTSPNLLLRLFEMEVPEIYDGRVVIKSAVREPGSRAKIAVTANDRDIDPIRACVGTKRSRIQAITRELRGEKIDIIEWSGELPRFAADALSPAKVNEVRVTDKKNRQIEVVVDEDQMALAIGKGGQNVRLASRLVGWKLTLRSVKKTSHEDNKETDALTRIEETAVYTPQIKSPHETESPAALYSADDLFFRVSETLTASYLEKTLLPYLKAVVEIQRVVDSIRGRGERIVKIRSVTQRSPISVNLEGASDAIQLIQELIVPWRKKHAQRMSELFEKEKETEIAFRKAEISERKARATKDRAEAGRLSAESAKHYEEIETMRLQNEKLRLELKRAEIQLVIDLLQQISPTLSEAEKIDYAIRLLPALRVVISSELEITEKGLTSANPGELSGVVEGEA